MPFLVFSLLYILIIVKLTIGHRLCIKNYTAIFKIHPQNWNIANNTGAIQIREQNYLKLSPVNT